MVLNKHKWFVGYFSRVCANEFKETLDGLNLIDLSVMGGKWTWTDQRLDQPSMLPNW